MRTRAVPALLSFVLLAAAISSDPAVDPRHRAAWPSVESQLASAAVIRGSELERLIRENQDFDRLDPGEADDGLPYPPWLRVLWRRTHPELVGTGEGPTGGYPRLLGQVALWLTTHQDLRPGTREPVASGLPPEMVAGSLEQRISGAFSHPRSESDIRINFWTPNEIISASNDILRSGSQAQFYSGDGGATWGQTLLPLITGDSFHSDPTVDWTSDGTAWSVTIGVNASGTMARLRSYRSADGGATWTFDSTLSGTQADTDKEMIWVDHAGSSPYKDNIYAIWDNGPRIYMNRRNGPSGAWAAPTQVSGAETLGPIGADVKTNSSGDLFGFWPDTGTSRIFLVKSTSGGSSYGAPTLLATTYDSYDIGIPSFDQRRALIYVSAGAYRTSTKDLVYASWVDLSGGTGCVSPANEPGLNTASTCKTRIWFARSTDGGAHWSPKVKINDQTSLNDQFNQWLAVDETSGRLSIIYYDTVSDPGRRKTDIWYQTSADDGVTWSTPFKVTTAQTDETVSGADNGNQYGDYNGLTAYAGVLFPSWTDRRNNAAEEIWTRKLEECLPPVEVSALSFVDASTLVWDPIPPGSGAGTVYQLVRGSVEQLPVGSGGAESCLDPSLAAATASDTATPAAGSGYWYLVRWRSACGTGTYGFRDDGTERVTTVCP